ncbi:MAG: thioredoxin [Acidobacteria bacterium]|nr:MAG: thioredoxin [Acidobacteriota bacterium]
MMTVTTETFDSEVMQAEQPVLIDFWGPRCGPCLALMPVVEELAREYDGKLKIVKINAQENRKLCVRLKVIGLPTFLFFDRGREMDRLTGHITAAELKEWVQRLASRASAHF